ncbi:hypothetical protein MB901379_01294 [Mycobacterium basiliense]|uniref:Protein-glutamine gamma-glutamyltransferase-like C-terminal domain-containing protein n=1 Tax=Mycobacterium basiliense TaxID=2094119 RepID=A0A447GB95_9MYCO|nr:DUF4129 domain-containing protein [Mycobacterium basiliense]VDM87747.1 hypothetical protein MB901379_01294 [Mycobacterium basiliense]
MPGIDKPTGRVVGLIVLLIVVAAALRGYLPARDGGSAVEPGSGRAALVFVIAVLSGSVALVAFAVIARLRDPRTMAPSTGNLSELLGRGRGQTSWRVLLIGLAVLVGWLLMAMLLSHLVAPDDIAPARPASDPSAAPSAGSSGAPPTQRPADDPGDTLTILLVFAAPLLLLTLGSAAVLSHRRGRVTRPGAVSEDHIEPPVPSAGSELLVRVAEVGLAEMADLHRDPRAAIIACYAAMERELANVPAAVPQDFDTPTEVLARAVEHRALQADNAVQLVNLFAEARFSSHVMNERHRELAMRVLRLVLDELAAPAGADAVGGQRGSA